MCQRKTPSRAHWRVFRVNFFVLQQLCANEMGTLAPIRAQEGGVPREILVVIPPEPDLGKNTPFLASDGRESAFSVPVYLLYG